MQHCGLVLPLLAGKPDWFDEATATAVCIDG